MSRRLGGIGRALVGVVVALIAAIVGWALFVAIPDSTAELLGIVLTIALVVVGLKFGSNAAGTILPTHNVAEVAVEGPITRNGGSPSPLATSIGIGADDIVEQIERADADGASEALLLRLNTPGGQVVPSDDIQRAAATFDGPVVAYTNDMCASGGYWIASGCDEIWAHEASLVGSIGVLGSRPNVSELAEDLGVSYERFVAGAYKDAGMPLKELSEDERAYLQGIVDEFYENFVDRVAEGRDVPPEEIRETEARVYLGSQAHELGLVDEVGTDDDVEERLEELIGTEPRIREYAPERGLAQRIRAGSQAVAYAFGAGIAGRLQPDDAEFRF